MTRRAQLLALLLVVLVGAIVARAYQVGLLPDPCERLRNRCAEASQSGLELDVAMKCSMIGVAAFGREMKPLACANLLGELKRK